MKKNNKGFSLVEILIVIAILAVVSSAGTISVKMIYNARVSTVARKVHSYCKTVRLNNMTKAKIKYIHIFMENGNYYINIDEQISINKSKTDEEIGNATLSVKYVTSSNIVSADNISIYFDRSGQCKVVDSSGTEISGVTGLRFSNGNRVSNLMISNVTGKVTM